LLIDRGTVGGDCSEADQGNLVVRPDSFVNGTLQEAGLGDVELTVGVNGPSKGDIEEQDDGSVSITVLGGAYEGSVFERDTGSVSTSVAAGATFKGSIEEEFDGNVSAIVEGLFEGNLIERGAGDLNTSGAGQIKGNSEHEFPGACSNTVANFDGTSCKLL
jgi:hypothetical protein